MSNQNSNFTLDNNKPSVIGTSRFNLSCNICSKEIAGSELVVFMDGVRDEHILQNIVHKICNEKMMGMDVEELNYFNGSPFMLSPTRGSVLVWNKKVKRWQDYECLDYETVCPRCHNTKLHIRAIKGTSYWGICSKCEPKSKEKK